MYDLTISIVVYKNEKIELMQTINSVLNSDLNIKLFIVDNSPTDDLKSLFTDPKIEYIYTNSNLGYGAGHNIAIKKALKLSKYHLVLNPDIYFNKGTLKSLRLYMDLHPKIGLLMPKVCNPDGSVRKIRRLLPTPYDIFGKVLFPNIKYTKERKNRYITDFISYEKEVSTPFLSGCFMFFRTSELDRVGIFDDRFFMYFEDVDLSRRFYSNSENIYLPSVSVVHLANQESHRNYHLFLIHLKSAFKYFAKWGWFFDKDRKKINNQISL